MQPTTIFRTTFIFLSLALLVTLALGCGGLEPTGDEVESLGLPVAPPAVAQLDLPGCEAYTPQQVQANQAGLLQHPDAAALVVVTLNNRPACVDTATEGFRLVGAQATGARPAHVTPPEPAGQRTSDSGGSSSSTSGSAGSKPPVEMATKSLPVKGSSRYADDPIPIIQPAR